MEKIKQDEFHRLVEYMRACYGINLEQKQMLVEGRLWNVIMDRGFGTLDEYFQFVLNDPAGQEIQTLVARLTTNYTYFMREEQHYHFLADRVLPELAEAVRNRDLCIWSAGCSSGEEPYTMAMVLDDFFGAQKYEWDCTVLATDISSQVLQAAAEGIYSEEKLQGISPEWRKRYFSRVEESVYVVKPELRQSVVFRSFNLMEPVMPWRRKMHIIFCRNVMIYFNKETRDSLVERLYDALLPGGYLFVGLSETINKRDSRFTFVKPSIYRKEG